ncbi:hypothetical protein OS493_036277 [Desmophyllum pertusum]|uniref:HECT domain-containing protein n=1 Tax=Desmophyllum pertusum TaxID=174260 RepID=A0A9X0D1H4_9CNID|nr:hypothetical protein OS493_036277 [Desmophyllum pertusum]
MGRRNFTVFVLGRCKQALESFREGLSALGVLQAVQTYPDSFRPLFCDLPEKLTAERMETLFRPNTSPVGSSRDGSDYLQDIEDAEDSDITLSDICFFTTGCKVLPQRAIPVTVEFLHEPGTEGCQGFPQQIHVQISFAFPVLHGDYESFKADMTFGFLNARGFGTV